MNQIERLGGKFDILLVAQSAAEIELIQNIFRQSKQCRNLRVLTEEEEALGYFQGPSKFHGNPAPDLVLLDLDLPNQGGRKILHAIKSDSILKMIPVLILASSEMETEVIQTYKSDANCFIPKPVAPDKLMEAIRTIEEFWLHVAKLPPRNILLMEEPS